MSEKETIELKDLPAAAEELTGEEAEEARGGIGLLLPAVQKVREAAASQKVWEADASTITDGTLTGKTTIAAGDGSV